MIIRLFLSRFVFVFYLFFYSYFSVIDTEHRHTLSLVFHLILLILTIF